MYHYIYNKEYIPVHGNTRDEALRNAVLDTYYRFYKNYNYKIQPGKDYYFGDAKTAEYLLKYLSGSIPIRITNDNGEFLKTLKETNASLTVFPIKSPEHSLSEESSKEGGFADFFSKPRNLAEESLRRSDSSESDNINQRSFSEEHKSNNSELDDEIFPRSRKSEYEPTERQNLPYYSIKETEMIKAMQSGDPDLIRLFSEDDYLRFQRRNCSIKDLPYAYNRYINVGDHAVYEGIRHVWKTRNVGVSGYQASKYCRAVAEILREYF